MQRSARRADEARRLVTTDFNLVSVLFLWVPSQANPSTSCLHATCCFFSPKSYRSYGESDSAKDRARRLGGRQGLAPCARRPHLHRPDRVRATGRRSLTGGVRAKGSDRPQFDFEFAGVRYRPTLARIPTEANLRRAEAARGHPLALLTERSTLRKNFRISVT